MKPLSPNIRADACTAQAKPARKALPHPFPEMLLGLGQPVDFWLVVWFRQMAKFSALESFLRLKATRKSCDKNEVLHLALLNSETRLLAAAYDSLERLQSAGGLLHAFAETSKLKAAA